MNLTQFKHDVITLNDEDIDEAMTICFKFLRAQSADYGKDGRRAEELLKIVAHLLDVWI